MSLAESPLLHSILRHGRWTSSCIQCTTVIEITLFGENRPPSISTRDLSVHHFAYDNNWISQQLTHSSLLKDSTNSNHFGDASLTTLNSMSFSFRPCIHHQIDGEQRNRSPYAVLLSTSPSILFFVHRLPRSRLLTDDRSHFFALCRECERGARIG